jgi:fatty acid desaturase
MTTPSDEPSVENLEAPGVSSGSAPHLRRVGALIVVVICAEIVGAFLATKTGRWDLFERSGSIVTAIGLFVASRRYLRFSPRELALLHAKNRGRSNSPEGLEDILTSKLGLAFSAFGTVIWGWGTYPHWWGFGILAIWALFIIRDAHRDSNRADSGDGR